MAEDSRPANKPIGRSVRLGLAGQPGPAVGGCPPEAIRGAARRGVAGDELAEADPGMRRLTFRRRRLAACWSCSARLSSRLVAGTAGSAANRSIKPSTITWASRSTSGSTVATGWSGRTLGVPPRRAMLVSTPRAGLLGALAHHRDLVTP